MNCGGECPWLPYLQHPGPGGAGDLRGGLLVLLLRRQKLALLPGGHKPGELAVRQLERQGPLLQYAGYAAVLGRLPDPRRPGRLPDPRPLPQPGRLELTKGPHIRGGPFSGKSAKPPYAVGTVGGRALGAAPPVWHHDRPVGAGLCPRPLFWG